MKRYAILVLIWLMVSPIAFGADFNPYLEKMVTIREDVFRTLPGQRNRALDILTGGEGLKDNINVAGYGDPTAIYYYGGQVQTRIGSFFTAIIPVDRIGELRHEKSIQKLSYTPALKPLLSIARPYVRAEVPHSAGYTGDDVIVAVVDTGIDTKHPDFLLPNGKSRILAIWDQTDSLGKVPTSFTYGSEWTKADIDGGLCREVDYHGHGTHVAGIAAGNGSASQGEFKGIAPTANLVIVKLDFSSVANAIDGIDYVFYKARTLGKPCVVNLSIGQQSGPHTANDLYNQIIDAIVDFYGNGNIIVWAAGNEGGDPFHTTNRTSTSEVTTIPLAYGSNPMEMEFWSTNLTYSFALLAPDNSTNIPFTNINNISNTAQTIGSARISTLEYSGARGLFIELKSGVTGQWKLLIDKTTAPFTMHGYLPFYGSYTTNNYFALPVYTGTINSLACQAKSISVASVTTRTNWTNMAGQKYGSSALELYNVSYFSSRGPTRDFVQKPEISAPGAYIISALSSNYAVNSIYKINEKYYIQAGTSMAAPVVSGVIALLLAKEPKLSVEELRTRLTSYTRGNSYKTDAGVWDEGFGYGIVNLSYFTNVEPSVAIVDVTVEGNILNFKKDPQSKMTIRVKSNSAQIGLSLQIKIVDRKGNLIKDFGTTTINQIEVFEYEWDGKDQFGKGVPAGLYYMSVSLGNSVSRKSILVLQ